MARLARTHVSPYAAAQDLIDKLEPTERERQFIHAYMSDLYVAPMENYHFGMVSGDTVVITSWSSADIIRWRWR